MGRKALASRTAPKGRGRSGPRRPRLLLVLRPREELLEALPRILPRIPSVFLSKGSPADRAGIEAALLGPMVLEGQRFVPGDYPRLRFVQRIYTGVDDLPFAEFPKTVAIAANSGGFAPYVAEHAIALALGSARSLVAGHAQVAAGALRPPPEVRTLRGETAVILGYGAIGRAIAERLRALVDRIVVVNRSGAPAPGCDAVFPASRLREALREGSFVFEARPLTASTARSIGTEELEAMPRNAVFVNVGRGGTVDEEALYHHLRATPTFRAAFDVWWDEDFEEGRIRHRFPLPSLPNFLGSPHSAALAPGGPGLAVTLALENLARFFRSEPPLHVVDRSEYRDLNVPVRARASKAPKPRSLGARRLPRGGRPTRGRSGTHRAGG